MVIAPVFGHGLAVSVEDLPLPLSAFYWGATTALVLSFVVLAAGGHRISERLVPRARAHEQHHGGRIWRVAAGAVGIAWIVITVATSMFGSTTPGANPAPNLVFVFGWIGIVVCAVTFGTRAISLHGPVALARSAGMRAETGARAAPAVGLWAAWGGLLLFVWLELVYPTAAHVRLLGVLVLVWLFADLIAASKHGTRQVRDQLDPFAVYMRVFASMSPVTHDGTRTRLRVPLLGANADLPPAPGIVALMTLLIGSVSFDGLTRTSWWQQRVARASAELGTSGVDPELARQAFGTAGLAVMLVATWLAFEGAAWVSRRWGQLRLVDGRVRTAAAFAPSLVPIALAYVVAHYFAYFVVQVQDLARLASDPLAQGWDLFGTADRTLRDLWVPRGSTVWMVQAGAIIIGHVAGLLLAHDRAVELAPNTRRATLSQIPMLVLMLLYTVGGLYFLSEGLQ